MQRAGGASMGLSQVDTALASTTQLVPWRAGNHRPSSLPETSGLATGDTRCPSAPASFSHLRLLLGPTSDCVKLSPVPRFSRIQDITAMRRN